MKQPATIAVDLTPILPAGENGGAKIFALELVAALAAHSPDTRFLLLTQSSSHDSLAILDRPNVTRLQVVESAEPGPTHRAASRGSGPLLAHAPERLRRLIARSTYPVKRIRHRLRRRFVLADLGTDLLFCPFTAPTFRERQIPTVCTVYDLQFAAYPGFFSAEDVVQRKQSFQDACRHADLLATISDYTRATVIANANVAPARVRTVHLRLASRIIRWAHQEGRSPRQLNLDGLRYFLYPANFWRHKNHEMLLMAFAMARASGLPEDIRLVCSGAPGERMDWLSGAAAQLGLASRVHFPGFLGEAEFAAHFANAVGIVFPSLYEGFGLPVIEAMAAGIPVACSNITALPEVAGDAAILFDPKRPIEIANAMVSLALDQSMRERNIRSGLLRAEEFCDPGRMAREYWELFQSAVALHGSSPRV